MKLTIAKLAYVRSKGLYITEKCDGCGKLLNHIVLAALQHHSPEVNLGFGTVAPGSNI